MVSESLCITLFHSFSKLGWGIPHLATVLCSAVCLQTEKEDQKKKTETKHDACVLMMPLPHTLVTMPLPHALVSVPLPHALVSVPHALVSVPHALVSVPQCHML